MFLMHGGFSSIALVVEGEAEGGTKPAIVTAGQEKDSTADEWHVHAGDIGVFLRTGTPAAHKKTWAKRLVPFGTHLTFLGGGGLERRQADRPTCTSYTGNLSR
ncbi:hypothetical protein C8F04DRAFT_1190693 [Mycena alexandri]|uniref:Uncharacterized protein n=1 Tax=Mycena alexandri TaxID=1745969 RepID=A0AAD6SIV8_9AGAR|nr:hypothetical protein C8F04DRAFT_1190693 [Mycena alexandri]